MSKFKNLTAELLEYTQPFIENTRNKPEVEGIVLLGGLGKRRSVDSYSDVDIAVFVRRSSSKLAPEWLPNFDFFVNIDQRTPVKKLNFNVHQQDIDEQILAHWSEVKKDAYLNGIVVFDRNDKLKELIKIKTTYSSDSYENDLIILASKLPPYTYINPAKQAKRGHYIQAHQIVNQGINLVMDTLFKINNVYVPHDKWKFQKSLQLDWLPNKYNELIREAFLVKKFDSKDVERRVISLKDISDQLMRKIEIITGRSEMESYNYACKKLLGRQLIYKTFSEKLLESIKVSNIKLTAMEMERISGFVNYHLIGSIDELNILIQTNSYNKNIAGADDCKKVLKLLKE